MISAGGARRPGRRSRGRGGAGATGSRRSSTCSGAGGSRPAGARSFERVYDLTERMIPPEILAATRAERGRRAEGAPRAGGPVARHRHRARPRRLLPHQHPRRPAARRRARRGGTPGAGHRRGLDATRRSSTPRRARRAGSTRVPCSRRSTRWSGSGPAPSGSSTSATGSRSTPRRRSGCTATTSCRSCSATSSSRASTSRPTGPTACSWYGAHSRSRATTRSRSRSRWPRSSRCSAAGSASTAWSCDDHGDLAPALRSVVG